MNKRIFTREYQEKEKQTGRKNKKMTMEQQIKANKIAKVRRYCTEPAKYKDGRLKRDYDAIKAHDYLKETLEQIRASVNDLKGLYSEEAIKRMLEDLEGERLEELKGIIETVGKLQSLDI